MEQLYNLPTPVKAILALLTGTSIVGAVAMIDTKLAGIVAIGLILLVIAIGGFLWLRSWARKRKARSMANELTQHSSSAPAGVNDAAKRARLDDMRRSFGEGLTKFGGADNIYKFPWYLIVGEPGSGKTEAIRHSNVGFPPGLQNEMQGVGGTINMNWWFTNQAVFLDTAGRLMFEEVKPGETNEWKEFLQLLVRNRHNCPVNGLLLIIPTDALIKDTEARMNEKAGKIAAQFELIQRTLDIRFPVFVMITKCDMMSGFREFFDDFADAASVNQMLGWSNPDDRDAPFAPERVTDHLATVVQRIKKRRLSLLRDPVPTKGEERRTDEVDALYSLPQSIQLLAPRLRQYLEKIFVAGPWSPKPLFLRGIYFTSSMREGAALDQELAQALGLSADQLSEAKVWEKERAYFLRDIFTEKVFREKGLVTRATNTKSMLRKRGFLLWGTATLLALTFVGFTFYAYQQFSESIKRHSDLWAAAKNPDDWKNNNWKPIVQGDKPADTVVKFRGIEPPVAVGDRRVPLLNFHEELRNIATQPIETGWVYRPMLKAAGLDADRLKAQRIVFEGSVVYPLAQAARARMQNEKVAEAADAGEGQDARLDREASALAALLRIESDKVSGSKKTDDLYDAVLVPLLRYVTAKKAPAEDDKMKQLRTSFEANYAGATPTAKWVPERLAIGATALAANAPIDAGLARLRALSGESISSQLESAAKIVQMRDDLRKFREIEKQMEGTASEPGDPKAKEDRLNALLAQLDEVKTGFDAKFKGALTARIISSEKASLGAAYQQLVAGSQTLANANFQLIRDAVKPHLANDKAKLFKEVDDELVKTLTNLTEQVKGKFSEDDLNELKSLDSYLEDFGNRKRIYEVRHATYHDAADVASKKDDLSDLIGKSWASYGAIVKEIDTQRAQLPRIQLKLTTPTAKELPLIEPACNTMLQIAQERRLSLIANEYLRQTKRKFDDNFFEPLVSNARGKSGARQQAESLMELWKLDRDSENFGKLPPPVQQKLNKLFSQFDAMKEAAAAADAYERAVAAFNEKMKALKTTVTFLRQAPAKWKRANGKGIFNGETPSWAADAKRLTLQLSDDPGQPPPLAATVSIDAGEAGEREASAGGTTLYFVVKTTGERPAPLPGADTIRKGPAKEPISSALTAPPRSDSSSPAAPAVPAAAPVPAPETAPAPTPAPPKATTPAKPAKKKGK